MIHLGYDKWRRRKSRKRFSDRPISSAIEALVCLGLLGAFGYGVFQYLHDSPALRVKSIRIKGTNIVSDQAVIEQSGLTTADAILFLDTDAVRKRVEALPYVESCQVRRFFPDKVAISIVERAPSATLLVNSRAYVVDEECVVLRELTPGADLVGPLITNVPRLSYAQPGQRLACPELADALAVWRAFCTTSMAHDVTLSEISAASANQICMYCEELSCEIRWRKGDFEQQARKLDVLWRTAGGQLDCNEYLDLRFGNDVACR